MKALEFKNYKQETKKQGQYPSVQHPRDTRQLNISELKYLWIISREEITLCSIEPEIPSVIQVFLLHG